MVLPLSCFAGNVILVNVSQCSIYHRIVVGGRTGFGTPSTPERCTTLANEKHTQHLILARWQTHTHGRMEAPSTRPPPFHWGGKTGATMACLAICRLEVGSAYSHRRIEPRSPETVAGQFHLAERR